jgi:hypothetical protein
MLLLLFAAAFLAAAVWHGLVLRQSVAVEFKRKALIQVILCVGLASVCAAYSSAFRQYEIPAAHIDGQIREVHIRDAGELGWRTDIFILATDGRTLGYSAVGTNKNFQYGEFVALTYQASDGDILAADFHDAKGHPDGHYRSRLLNLPYGFLFTAGFLLLFLWLIGRSNPEKFRKSIS